MNELDLRQQIRDRINSGSGPISDQLRSYMKCGKCKADFEWLLIGGAGDWKTTITCEACFAVQRGVPYDGVIIPLIAIQYGLSEAEARRRDAIVQEAYIASVARAADY